MASFASKSALRSLQQLTHIQRRSFASVAEAPISTGNALSDALQAKAPRYDWTKDEIRQIYNTPLMELAHQSVRTRQFLGTGQLD